MRSNIRWAAILLILALLLSGCQNAKPEAERSTETETQFETALQTEPAATRSDGLESVDPEADAEAVAAATERIRAFWEAHRDEMEAIAVEFLALAPECTDEEMPYVQYMLDTGLTAGDGLGKWKTVDAPETEQKLRDLCSLPDCPFDSVAPSVSRAWLDADFCGFSAYLTPCYVELLYFAEDGIALSEWFDHEVLSEHWVILRDWHV